MSLFKRAYARGINDELIRLGLVRYPTKEAADEVADAVGDQMPAEPAGEAVSPETAADVAATLVDAANKLVEETGMAEAAAPPEEALKTSAAVDIDTRASQQAQAAMYKLAMEKEAMGSTIEGGDKGNTLTDAAQTTGEGKVEADRRPDLYANKGVQGVGQTDHPAGRDPSAQVGTEEAHPDQPGASDAGSVPPSAGNTVVEQSKTSALRSIIQKVAMGSTIEGGDKGNALGQAAATTGEGKVEADRRPEGYAHKGVRGVGQTDHPAGRDPQAAVGHEVPHPHQPGESPAGAVPGNAGNTVVEQSNASKKAEENPFLALFKKTAEEVAEHLPANMGEDEKIAHIRRLMGLNDSERTEYIGMLHKDAGASDGEAIGAAEKHAACVRERRRYSGNPNRQDRTRANQKTGAELTPAQEKLPEALKSAIKAKGDGGGKEETKETKDEGTPPPPPKKEEKGDEKEAHQVDLLSRIRQIAQTGASANA